MSTPPPTPVAPAQVECPQCRHQLPYFDAIHSAFFGCPQCHTFFQYGETGPPKKLRKFPQMPSQPLTLPLGTTGELLGQAYRVTGYMLRKEAKTKARWEEYMLWNAGRGVYHQLAVYHGHWMLIEPTDSFYRVYHEASDDAYLNTDEASYYLYNTYSPRIIYAAGEFDWNVFDDESLTISEFINPPFMRIREQRGKTPQQWFVGRHLEPSAIEKGFQISASRMPARQGIGAVQPAPVGAAWPALRTFSLLMALAVVLTHLLLMSWGNETVLDTDFVSSPPSTPATQPGSSVERPVHVSPSFTVPGTGALSIKLWANVDNSWVELPFTVVNEQTGQLFEATRGVEYYHGVEAGESWSEGSTETDALLNRVPAGRYHLNFYPAADPNNLSTIPFRVTVQARASFGSNAFLALLLLLLYPGVQYYRRYTHEQERHEGSA